VGVRALVRPPELPRFKEPQGAFALDVLLVPLLAAGSRAIPLAAGLGTLIGPAFFLITGGWQTGGPVDSVSRARRRRVLVAVVAS
jgi:hypothetical protein